MGNTSQTQTNNKSITHFKHTDKHQHMGGNRPNKKQTKQKPHTFKLNKPTNTPHGQTRSQTQITATTTHILTKQTKTHGD